MLLAQGMTGSALNICGFSFRLTFMSSHTNWLTEHVVKHTCFAAGLLLAWGFWMRCDLLASIWKWPALQRWSCKLWLLFTILACQNHIWIGCLKCIGKSLTSVKFLHHCGARSSNWRKWPNDWWPNLHPWFCQICWWTWIASKAKWQIGVIARLVPTIWRIRTHERRGVLHTW